MTKFASPWSRLVVASFVIVTLSSAHVSGQENFLDRARRLLNEVPLIDGHNDVPWQYRIRVDNHLDQIDLAGDTSELTPPMHTDLARLRKGLVGGQFWSVYIPSSMDGPGAARAVFEQIDVVHRLIERYPDAFELALTAGDIERIHGAGKVASLIGMEGGHSIENSLAVLRETYGRGARYMTLTHGRNVAWADACSDVPVHHGLSRFGEEVVREMNRLGMLVDISHVSAETMHDVLDMSDAPVFFSHSSARGVVDHRRNVPDDVLWRLPENGGVVMVNFVPYFISEGARQDNAATFAERSRFARLYPHDPERQQRELEAWRRENPLVSATLEQVADHIDHIRRVAGIDHIGLGSDFDGLVNGPIGLEDVSKYPNLIAELLRRGYSDADARKVAGMNALRVLRETELVAARLQKERPPSDALISELDGPR